MVLCGANQMVHKTLAAAGIPKLMPVLPTVDDALRELRVAPQPR